MHTIALLTAGATIGFIVAHVLHALGTDRTAEAIIQKLAIDIDDRIHQEMKRITDAVHTQNHPDA